MKKEKKDYSKEEKNKKNNKKGQYLLLAIFAICFVASIGYVGHYYYTLNSADDTLEAMQTETITVSESTKVIQTENQTDTLAKNEQTKVTANVLKEEKKIDFETLQEKNPDIYAWIEVPGTVIDYPILQSADDDAYYLNHTVDKKEGLPASIYTEKLNKKSFSDNNTVIYGHNMKNGTMFAGLHDFADKEFFEENNEVIIYTPEKTLHYDIFAAYKSNDAHILMTYDFTNEQVYTSYLTNIYSLRNMSSNISDTIKVTPEDKIITLETCVAGDFHGRYLVQAVLQE